MVYEWKRRDQEAKAEGGGRQRAGASGRSLDSPGASGEIRSNYLNNPEKAIAFEGRYYTISSFDAT